MDQLDNPHSRIDCIKHVGRETVTALAIVDDLIVHRTNNAGLVLEFIRYGANNRVVESFRVTVCPEDVSRIHGAR